MRDKSEPSSPLPLLPRKARDPECQALPQGAGSPGRKAWSYPRLGTNYAQCPEARRVPQSQWEGDGQTIQVEERGGGLRGHNCAGEDPTGEAGAGEQGYKRKTRLLKVGGGVGGVGVEKRHRVTLSALPTRDSSHPWPSGASPHTVQSLGHHSCLDSGFPSLGLFPNTP